MKKYKVLKPIMLGFLTPQDSFDADILNDGSVTLEANDTTIWAVKNGERQESITVGYAIGIWLKQGKISELVE